MDTESKEVLNRRVDIKVKTYPLISE